MFSHLMRRPSSRTTSRRKRTGVRLLVEDLEGRTLLTAIPINFGATVMSPPVVVNGEMFFAANDSTHGVQLWESNGTAAGTVRLTDGNDVNGGIYPSDLTAVGGTLYFSADDGSPPSAASATATSSGRATVRPPAPSWSPTATTAWSTPACSPTT